MAVAQPRIKLALVGTGAELAQAVEAFNGLSTVEIVIVVDVEDRAAGARLAQRLGLAPRRTSTDAFKAKPNIVRWAGTRPSTSACWPSSPPASR
jgi:predicted dehydrogenase